MSHDWQADVREFHRACCPEQVVGSPAIPDGPTIRLRLDLINEEIDELAEALVQGDMVEIVDALFDLLYVVVGTAEACGIDLGPAWIEGHRSNVSKIGPDGQVARRSDGKILHGPNYRPPDFLRVLRAQGWERPTSGNDMEDYL